MDLEVKMLDVGLEEESKNYSYGGPKSYCLGRGLTDTLFLVKLIVKL